MISFGAAHIDTRTNWGKRRHRQSKTIPVCNARRLGITAGLCAREEERFNGQNYNNTCVMYVAKEQKAAEK